MPLRDRLVEWIAPGQTARLSELETDLSRTRDQARVLRDSLETFADVLRDEIVTVRSPREMIAELQESGLDDGLLQQLVYQIGWDQIGALSGAGDDSKQERSVAVEQAVRLFRYSPLAQWAIWLWTGWGLGDRITVTLPKAKAQEVWDEFVTAERNESVLSAATIHELSDWLLVRGNRFLAFFTATRGEDAGHTTVRQLDQDEIELVSNPEDKLDVWFYKRTFSNGGTLSTTLYYPDYRSLIGQGNLVNKRWAELQKRSLIDAQAKRADQQQPGTSVCVMHIAHNRKDETSSWGWPLTTTAGPWVKGHKQFSEARLGVAMAISQFVRRSRVQGGSRAVSSILSQIDSTLSQSNYLDTNPPGAPGSWHVENQASKTEELPMRTGASDAKDDNELFSWMALLGMGLFPTSAGLDTSRWATAVEMDKAQAMLFERYQRFWTAQFQTLVRIVLRLADLYTGAKFKDTDLEADISTDTFSLSDYPAVSEAVATQVEKMLEPYTGIIPKDTVKALLALLWRMSLSALGSGMGEDLTTDEAFGVGLEEEPVPVVPPPAVPGEEPASSEPATGDEEDETEPAMESEYIHTLKVALHGLDNGDITPAQFAEFMMGEIGEVYQNARSAS